MKVPDIFIRNSSNRRCIGAAALIRGRRLIEGGTYSSPPRKTLQFATFFPAIFKYVLENTKRLHKP